MMKKILLLLLALTMALTVPAHKSKPRQAKRQQSAATTQKKTTTNQKSQQKKQPSKAELEARQKKLKTEQQAARKRQQELEQQVGRRLQDAQALANEIEDRQTVIDSIRHEVAVLDSGIAVLAQELQTLQKELDERREQYVQSVRYMYRNRKSQNQMMFILSAKNFNQMYRRMRFSGEYATYQKAQSEAIRLKQDQVDQKRQELQGVRNEKAALLTRSEKEQKQLATKREEEQKMVAALRKEQKTVQNLIARQKKEENELNASIQKLIEEEQARARAAAEAEARRTAQQDRNNGGKDSKGTANKGKQTGKSDSKQSRQEKYTEPAADRKLSGNFSSNKGRLPYPITGAYKVIRGMGNYVIDKVTLPSKSLYLKGQAGAKARCVFDGVVAAIVERSSGYVILVRHGSYFSLYANISRPSVKMGDKVKTNQALGSLGNDYLLLFQLRKGKEALNPKHWLGR